MRNKDNLPALTVARFMRGSIVHITDDAAKTRCGRNCSDWARETEPSEIGRMYMRRCTACGTPEQFQVIEDHQRAVNAEYERQRRESIARANRHDQIIRQTEKAAMAVIEKALVEAGFEVFIEQNPGTASLRPFRRLFVVGEGENGVFALESIMPNMTSHYQSAKARWDADHPAPEWHPSEEADLRRAEAGLINHASGWPDPNPLDEGNGMDLYLEKERGQ